ncbi:MBL fold metallo-hydrolase [Maricaulis maris]|uniref:MBL fold metallo-hydrolase n=1 Tax=Maricaulis maris TaxID=74318 RepID=UPI003B8D4138
MNRQIPAFIAALMAMAAPAVAQDVEPIEIRMIANMGVLISQGEKRVLIDALFTDVYDGRFRVPTEADRTAMMDGTGEFGRSTLFLFTHSHGDHFHGPSVMETFQRQNTGQLIGPHDVLVAANGGNEIIRTALENLPVGGPFSDWQRERNGFDMDSRLMFHADGIDNLTYALTFGETTLLHLGDTDPDRADLTVWDDMDIDVVMYPVWWAQSELGQAKLRGDWADARHIALHIPAHISREDAVAHFGEGHVLVDAGERITIDPGDHD